MTVALIQSCLLALGTPCLYIYCPPCDVPDHPSLRLPLPLPQTSYSQHNWWETRDCTQPGKCPTETDEAGVAHPVTHIGFESHANYYEQSPLMVYAWKNATFKGGYCPVVLPWWYCLFAGWLPPQPAFRLPYSRCCTSSSLQGWGWRTWAACGWATAHCQTSARSLCPPPTML
jgi:hypothetical protein